MEQFEMVAKTFQGLEEVLAEELRALGAKNVEPGRRMVSFEGDLETLYKANLCCRTALRVLKPFYKFIAKDPEELYDMVKEYDWSEIMTPDKSFSIDVTAFSDEFTHSRYATYRIKDAIADYFVDRYDKRPNVCLQGADVQINAYISGDRVVLSLDSSGESLHKRGYRVAQTEAPINEVLAAGIILRSGWRGDCPLVDPMCGSGTFLIEAALIAANINPGVYRRGFAFEQWPDFDEQLLDRLYNDDSQERDATNVTIYGADISPKAIAIAEQNIKSAGVGRYIKLENKPLSAWDEAPADGILVTNPPYGERISVEDMDGLYASIGTKLKHVFKGYHAWIIGYRDEYFEKIGLSPSVKIPMYNGALECELREYIIFDGDYRSFRAAGGRIKGLDDRYEEKRRERRPRKDEDWRRDKEFARGDRGKSDRGKRERATDHRDFKKRFESDKDRYATREERQRARRERFNATGAAGGDLKAWWNDRRERKERGEGRPKFGKSERGEGYTPKPRQDADIAYTQEIHEDNPLAARRNVHALKSIQGKKPSLSGPVMRTRRGWKRPDNDDTSTDQ